MQVIDIAIIGAGPYGLSLAAHLRATGLSFRVVGRAMENWRERMPEGMLLKSDGFASDLSDPERRFRLRHYCSEYRLPYDDTRVPVALSSFVDYGLEFQRRMVPELEDAKLIDLNLVDGEFALTLDTGETFRARKVVLAVGISYFAYVPEILAKLRPALLSHSSEVPSAARFRTRKVVIIGGGASAIDLAALLHEAGADVTVAARRSALRFHSKPSDRNRTWLERLRQPSSGIGPGWKTRLLTDFPHLFRFLPLHRRLKALRTLIGPSAGWPMRERVEGRVRVLTGVTLHASDEHNGRPLLTFAHRDGSLIQIEADHVIACTGYRVDLRQLPFLPDGLRKKIRSIEHMPLLSGHFESFIPGLYFIGVSSALTFGPMMRFAYGAAYTAVRLTRHLANAVRLRSRFEQPMSVQRMAAQGAGADLSQEEAGR
jgi:Pyridine nucleotide-disulphide oxidoreductase